MLGCQTPLWTKHAAKSLGFVLKSLAMYVDRASDAFRIFEGIVEILRGARDLRAEVPAPGVQEESTTVRLHCELDSLFSRFVVVLEVVVPPCELRHSSSEPDVDRLKQLAIPEESLRHLLIQRDIPQNNEAIFGPIPRIRCKTSQA